LNIEIRAESAFDARAIEAVTVAAFHDAPHTSHTEHHIVDALRRAGELTVSLVAECNGEIVGHVAVSPVTISDGTSDWYGLGPISVLPGYQRRGIGSQLVAAALEVLRMRGAAGCVLLGEPAFYGRFEFKAEPQLKLPGVPPEYFQALAFGPSRPQGTVAYHAAFDARA
jgi:putative acetyltransferase